MDNGCGITWRDNRDVEKPAVCSNWVLDEIARSRRAELGVGRPDGLRSDERYQNLLKFRGFEKKCLCLKF